MANEGSRRATSLAYLMTAQWHLKDHKEPYLWPYLGLRCGIWRVSKSHISSLFSDCPVAFEGSQRATSLAYLMTAQWHLKDHKEQHLWLFYWLHSCIWRFIKGHISGLFCDCAVAFEGSQRATSLAYLGIWKTAKTHISVLFNDSAEAFEGSPRATSLAFLVTAQWHLKYHKEPHL